MSGPDNEREAKKLELMVDFDWAAMNVSWPYSKLSTQEHALLAFFSQAFEFAGTNSRPIPRALAQQKRAHYRNMAYRIRTDVADLVSFSAEVLIEAAFAYEALADAAAPPPGHPLHVQRKRRGDERQTAFVLQLVDASRAIFDQPLYGIVSVVANVAFECRDWSDARVRKVIKGTHPSPKRATIGP